MRSVFNFFFFPFFLFPLLALAQNDEYFDETYLRYEDRTYQKNIKTVQFHVRNVPLSLPVIKLGSSEQLQLQFDELDAEYQDYTYTVIHCDRNWEPTNIPQQEYIDGFLEENILNYDFSFNTVQQYIHYSFSVPNQNLRLKLSGNYVLIVYKDFDREKPIITRRFRVYEQLVEIAARVRIPMIINQRRTHQQIDVEIIHPDFDIRNPFADVALHIQQNYRWDNIKTDMKPIFIKDQRLVYDNMGEVVFEGGNEFRWIDTRSLRYQPENVSNIWYDPDSMKNHVFLIPDKMLSKDHYRTFPDINGAFSIDIREGTDPTRDADYALIHHSLKYQDPILDGGLYLYGGLTDWQIKPEHRLEYNYRDRTYEGSTYLKQGYYNYQYIYLRDGTTQGETEVTEGSFFDARQIYTLYVYHQQMGSRFDRLIGHSIITSQTW
ncbi:MAG: DUF5103 domain-containing protein [Flavobacteriales bacterium]|nr:DUF5103 domain-containing protein [Flavobacteriales bacterium]MCB9192055.1 DUF5103 domain-containing protein [Flavobacteriales bacterium]